MVALIALICWSHLITDQQHIMQQEGSLAASSAAASAQPLDNKQ